jgi:hypothetical protein
MFDKLKDAVRIITTHVASDTCPDCEFESAVHGSHEHGAVAPEPNSQLKCDSCGNPVFEGHYSVLCHKPCCYDAATALVKAEASAINWHDEYIRVLEESQSALAASQARLRLAEEKLAEHGIIWDVDRYCVFGGKGD